MKTEVRFEVQGWFKTREEDVWEKGCIPPGTADHGDFPHWSSKNLKELLEMIWKFTGSENKGDVQLDSCEEEGRVNVQVYEGEDGQPANEHEYREWKAGRYRLFLTTYSFHVERVDRTPVRLEGFLL